MNKIGIDLGGTKTEVILLDEDNTILYQKRIPTPKDYDDILNSICDLVGIVKSNGESIGVCAPGVVSSDTGLVKNSNTQCLVGKSLHSDLEKKLGQKISMENDANCFALAEAKMGAARGYRIAFGVIMGTGVGGGLVIDQKIHRGRNEIAGEWGHHILHTMGNKCYCGKNGCVETYLSGPALEKRWGDITGTSHPLEKVESNLDSKLAISWKNEFLENFAQSISNVISIIDPDVIVLGGGVSNLSFLYTDALKFIKKFHDINTPILQNKLGDSAGVFGACMI